MKKSLAALAVASAFILTGCSAPVAESAPTSEAAVDPAALLQEKVAVAAECETMLNFYQNYEAQMRGDLEGTKRTLTEIANGKNQPNRAAATIFLRFVSGDGAVSAQDEADFTAFADFCGDATSEALELLKK